MYLGNLTQARLQTVISDIPEPTRFDIQPEVPSPVFALLPAEVITVALQMKGLCSTQRESGARFNFALEPIEPPLVDGVLQPCMPAFDPITIVALRGHDGLGHRNQLVRRH